MADLATSGEPVISEQQLRQAVEAARLIVWEADLATEMVTCSANAKAVWGLSHGPRARFLERVHPDDRARVEEASRQAAEGSHVFLAEYRVLGPDGIWRWIASRGELMYDAAGRPEKMTGFSADVSHRMEAEEALRSSEARYRSLALASSEAVWTAFTDGRDGEGVEWWCGLTGQTIEATRNWGWLDVVHPEDRVTARSGYEDAIRTGSPFTSEFRVRTATGEYRHLQVRGVPVVNTGNTEWVGTFTDITSLRQAERAALETASFHKSLGDAIPGMVWTSGPDGTPDYLNQTFFDYTGVTMEEMRSRPRGWAVHPEDLDNILSRFASAQKTGESCEFEFRYRRRDGVFRWFLGRVVPVMDGSGALVRWVGTSVDIHEQKMAEQAARESAERLAIALRAAAAGTWDFDIELQQAVWSDQCAMLHGLPDTTSTISYDTWLGLVHPDDRARTDAALRFAMEKGGEVSLEYRVPRLTHGYRWLLALGQSVADTGKVVRLSGITIDISDRRQMEERLRQSAKMEAIGQLAGGLAHDFNNQLHALSGLLEFVARDSGLSPDSRNDINEIQTTAERMASLTRQLLAFSRQQVLVPETIDLNTAVLDTRPMLQRLVGSDLEMQLRLSPEDLWVKVDRTQLLQVLMNLTINARDAMPDGGRLIISTASRRVRGRELDGIARGPVLPGTYAELSVQDSGTGISREDLARIFDAFFTTKPVGEGTGLGLANVDGILSQSRGHIWAESEAGEGATFRVLLPLTNPPLDPTATVPLPPVGAGTARRLLVVDDEAMVREVIVRTLVNHGYQVHQAVNGEDALERLAELTDGVDLVLSDVVMPVMGGAELALRMNEQYPGIPIVWMSGYPRETVIGRGRLGEDQPFLQKPVAPGLLLETVAKAVAR